ncbi:MAG: hydrolase TatD [Gammaproteobacteria bacterium]|nr:hydrolase TatD [Gammaproteobacteria bacterium]NIV49677.1 hydrolase TatD [Gammaproteobacteria bacterium]NIW57075.1 hydrolase TatD [Gammaproteobacteria bacterium]
MVHSPELVDIGANLSHDSFRHDLEQVLERARTAGVAQMIVTGASETESLAAHDIAATHPGVLFSTAGVHPHLAREWTGTTRGVLSELAQSPVVVAVGEAGLDFNRDFSPRAAQERVFEEQLELAADLAMPVFMHERDAHERFVAILSGYRARLGGAVIHCFTGNAQELDRYLEMDLHVGITGWICDERRGTHLRELVSRIPQERLMLETDSPYLLPRDLQPRPKSRRNEPMYLAHILKVIAACRGADPEELAVATTRNARAFFGLEAR